MGLYACLINAAFAHNGPQIKMSFYTFHADDGTKAGGVECRHQGPLRKAAAVRHEQIAL
jgi:hypothetical protein